MNTKVLLSFVAGVIGAAGVSYLVMHPRPTPPAVTEVASVPEPAPAHAAEVAPAAPVASPAPPQPVNKKRSPRVPVKPASPEPAVTPEAPTQVAAAIPPPPVAPAPEPAHEPVPAPAAVIEKPAAEKQPEPRQPRTVTIPSGTRIGVRLNEAISTERNHAGDTFTATLDEPLSADGFVIAERGARVEGRIAELQEAGRVKGVARLVLELNNITTSDRQQISIRTAQFEHKGPESKKEDAAKVGIGAALGSVIGAIAGGGSGAAIGAAAGGAAGAGTVAATRGKPAVLPSEMRLSFLLEQPVTVTERLH